MKRTAKIFALLLAFVLIFGATAMLASAAPTDATTKITATFNGQADGFVIADASTVPSSNPKVDNVTFQFGGRAGKAVAVKNPVDGNVYTLITQENKVNGGGPYAWISMGGNGSYNKETKTLTKGGNDFSNYKYISVGFDFMAPLGKVITGNVDLGARAFYDESTSRNFWNSDATTKIVQFGNDADGVYLWSAACDSKKYVNPYEFTNVQIIIENNSTIEDGKTVEFALTTYVYVDGEFWFSKAATKFTDNSNKSLDGRYCANEPHTSFIETKFNINDADDPTVSWALDNINYFTVPYATETTVADCVTYDEATVPFGIALAEVDGVKYDNLANAIAACPEKDTMKLLANSNTPIVVDKEITIDGNGFTGKFIAGEGYAVDDMTTPGVYKVISSAGQTIEVIWDDCFDGACDEDFDINHPFYHYEEEVSIYTKFFDVYNPTYTGLIGNDGKVYTLAGWKNVATDEVLTADSAVTEELCGEGFVELAPIYVEADLDFIYTKGGETVYVGNGEDTFVDVLKAADAGSTVTLMDDVDITATIAIPGKAITIDFNGYTVKAMASGSNTKWSMFALSTGTQLTLTSSKVGAKVFNEGFNGAANKFGAAGLFNANPNAKLYINAKDAEGNNTISFFTGNFIQGYDKGMEYHIDGGFYVCNGGDQQGFIDLRKAGFDSTIKNATFYGMHEGGAVAYAARNHQIDDTPTVTIDNCVFIGIAPTARVAYPVVITITNSYIYANVAGVKSGTYSKHSDSCACANQNGNVILGEGVYMTGTTSGNVSFAEGYNFYNVATVKEVTYQTQAWASDGTNYKFLDASFDVTTITEELSFDKQTSNTPLVTIPVTWKNAEGEVIGTSEALPGTKAIVPSNLKGTTFIDKWLEYVPAEWATDLNIPVGVTEYEIIAKEGGAYTLQGAVKFLGSYTLQSHAQTNLFIPIEAEGITITKLLFNGTDRLANMNGNYRYKINGDTYKYTAIWPGVMGIYNDFKAEITFTYEGNTYTSSASFNIAKYAAYVLDDANGYSEAGQAVAANFANYVYALAVARGSSNADKLAALVAENEELLIKIPESEKVATDMSKVSEYVSGVGISISDYAPNFTFKVVEGTGATIKVNGEVKTQTANNRFTSIDTVWLNVVPTEGETINVQFSLAGFYAHLAADGAADTTLALVEAMYGVAKADVAY